MIILFIKSDRIRAQSMPDYVCPNCSKPGGMDLELHQRYADFAGGKVYPSGVFGVAQCGHCGYTLPASRWPDELHRAFVALKAGYRIPITYWKGAIRTAVGFGVGVVLLVGVLWVMGRRMSADIERDRIAMETALTQPTPGLTLATTDGSSGLFDVWRVSRVAGDVIWLRKYTGSRKLTNFFTEIGWKSLPDSDFDAQAIAFSKTIYADKGLKRIEDVADKTKPYEAIILAMLR